MDCRKELREAAAIAIGGAAVAPSPGGSEVGGIVGGQVGAAADILGGGRGGDWGSAYRPSWW